MIEIQLRRQEIDPKTKETKKDGVIDTIRVVLTGKDKDNSVEWTVTLKHEGTELPKEYRKMLGKSWYDSVYASLSEGAQQKQL